MAWKRPLFGSDEIDKIVFNAMPHIGEDAAIECGWILFKTFAVADAVDVLLMRQRDFPIGFQIGSQERL